MTITRRSLFAALAAPFVPWKKLADPLHGLPEIYPSLTPGEASIRAINAQVIRRLLYGQPPFITEITSFYGNGLAETFKRTDAT